MSHVHAFPMHTYLLFIICDIIVAAWDFSDCLVLFLPLFLLTLVVFMASKRKSTPARNPLHSDAFSSSDPSPSNVRFRDDDAFKDFWRTFLDETFIQNAKSFCRTLSTSTFPLSFTVGDGSHCVTSQLPVLLCLSRSFTPTCTRLII